MANDASRSIYQGLGVPDPRLGASSAVWDAESTNLEQADPQPGVPVPSQATALALTSGGTQAADSSVDIRCNRGGLTGPGQGGFVWRNTGDTDWYGHDHAAAVSYAEAVRWGTATTDDHYSVDVTADEQGNVYIVSSRNGPPTSRQVVVDRIDNATGAKTTATVASGLTTAFEPHPAIVLMPDGSLQVWYWAEAGSSACQIRVARSTDSGATWTTTATGALDVPVDISGSPGAGADGYDVDRIRVAVGNSQTLLVARLIAHDTTPTYREVTMQAAGPGNGEALTVITTTDGTSVVGWPDVAFAHGRFYVLVHGLPTANRLVLYIVGNALTDFTTTTSVTDIGSGTNDLGALDGTGQFIEEAQCEIWVDDVGALYAMAMTTESPTPYQYATLIGRSTDQGLSWAAMGSYPGGSNNQMAICFNTDDTGTRLNLIAAHWATGRCVVPFTHVSSGTTLDDSLAVLYIGGYSTVTLPGLDQFAADDRRSSWFLNGLPLDLPGVTQWTANTTGTATQAISTSDMRLDLTTTSGTQWYSIAPPNTTAITQPITAAFAFRVNSGGRLDFTDVGIRMQLSDGSDRYQIAINATTTGFRVRDLIASSDLATETVDMTTAREILIGFVAGSVSVWYRTWNGAASRQWTNVVDAASLSTTTGVSSDNIQWGHINSQTADSSWYRWPFVDGDLSGLGLADGQSNPTDTIPRYWGRPPFANQLPGGLKLSATRGPGRVGDEWVIATRYGYGVDQAFFTESPAKRDTHRTTATGAQKIALRAFSSGTVAFLGDTILIGGANTNYSDFDLEGYTSGGSWTTLANFDTSISIPGGNVYGDTFVPSGTSTVYVQANEFAGATLKIGTAYRRIVRHSGGMLGTSTGSRVAEFQLEGMTGSETVSSPAIIPKDWVVRYELAGSRYRALRLSIASQTTAEGYFQHKLIPCRMEVFGVQPGFGWQESTRANVGADRSASGVVRTNRRGDPPRTFTLAWTDGVYGAQVQGASGLSPDFLLTYDNGQPNGLRFDTVDQIRGILREVDGPEQVAIMLRRVEKLEDPARSAVYNRRDQFGFVRLDSEVTVENIRGYEFDNEFVRIAQITVDEVV